MNLPLLPWLIADSHAEQSGECLSLHTVWPRPFRVRGHGYSWDCNQCKASFLGLQQWLCLPGCFLFACNATDSPGPWLFQEVNCKQKEHLVWNQTEPVLILAFSSLYCMTVDLSLTIYLLGSLQGFKKWPPTVSALHRIFKKFLNSILYWKMARGMFWPPLV